MHYRETGFVPCAWRTNQVLKNQRLLSMASEYLAAILWALGVLPGSQLAYNCSNSGDGTGI
jgi:hypothetical protein